MFSFQNSPVELEGFSVIGQKMDNISPGFAADTADFSKIMSDFQGEGHFQELEQKLASMQNTGLTDEQLNMLQQLIADGKTLPQAAETVFAALQQQLAEMLENGRIPTDLEQLHQQLTVLAEILPDKIKKQLETVTDGLKQALQELPNQVGQGIQKTAENASIDQPMQQEDTVLPVPVTPEVVTQPVITEAGKELKNQIRANLQTATTTNNHPGHYLHRGPVIFQENLGPLPEQELVLESGKAAADNKVVLNQVINGASSRINPAMLNDQLSASQASTGISGDRSGAGLQGNGQNTSFTQLMNQATPQLITQNIHKPEWGGAVAQRITWMIGNKLQSAQLRITPAHLGPVDIKLSIENNLAQVSFASNHQVVRDALEQALPRLKEMLEEQDLDLVNVDISERRQAERDNPSKDFSELAQNSTPGQLSQSEGHDLQIDDTSRIVMSSEGLLDTYA